MRYAIVIEGEAGHYSTYVPDLPGCVAAGESIDDVTHDIAEAIQMYIDGLKEDRLEIPEPTTQIDYVEL